jgi:phosphotriesterase-related protein
MYTDKVNGNEVPTIYGTSKAGIIKTASDGRDIRLKEDNLPIYYKLFSAAGKAAKKTGAPVMTHLEMGKGADSQLEVLTKQGIAPNRIIMSHLDRVVGETVRDYQLQVAKSGVYLQFDTIGRFKYHDDVSEAELIAMLCEKGFENQILIGLDTTNERLKSYGGSIGLDYIMDSFQPQLKKYGIGDELFHRFTVINPMRALCIES